MMILTCKLWKITLIGTMPNDSVEELVFWGYHMNESKARDAALRWGEQEMGRHTVVSITAVDEIR